MKRRLGFWLVVMLWAALFVGSLAGTAMAAKRFSVSPEGVIKDSKTGLEWVVGPDGAINVKDAEAWVKGCQIAGGGWRFPTQTELKVLYVKGLGKYNLDPVFKVSAGFDTAIRMQLGLGRIPALRVLSKPRDSSSYNSFTFLEGDEPDFPDRIISYQETRVFGVRSAKK